MTTATLSQIDLISEAETARALGYAPTTLKAARLGRLRPDHPLTRLPVVRLGKKPQYRRADIEQLIRDHVIMPDHAA